MGADPILDLSALAPERPTIRIRTEENPDGELWELRVERELSIQQLAELQRLGKSAEKLGAELDLSAEEARLLEGHLDDLLTLAFVKPWQGNIGPVTMQDKVAIAGAFIGACFGITPEQLELLATPEQAKPKTSRKKPTGVKS